MSGPVSEAIERDVLEQVRRSGIVIWLDKEQQYSTFVDGLAGRQQQRRDKGESYVPVVGFRGSFLELMLKLENFGDGLDRKPLLVHMPGFDKDSIKHTPVLELYTAGTHYERSLEAIIRETSTGRLLAADVERLVVQKPTVDRADAHFQQALAPVGSGLSGILRGDYGSRYLLDALADNAKSLRTKVQTEEDLATLQEYLEKLTGMGAGWKMVANHGGATTALATVIDNLGAWLMCVEYVHDLLRAPKRADLKSLQSLAPTLVIANGELLSQFRKESHDAYKRRADEVEGILSDEFSALNAEDLGKIDTFRVESIRMLEGAVDALLSGDWKSAKQWANARPRDSFWLADDPHRQASWALVEQAATTFELIATHPNFFQKAREFADIADEYCRDGAQVDRAHHQFERLRSKKLNAQLPQFSELLEVAKELSQRHRTWANSMAMAFSAFCDTHGFLPPAALMQRTIYEEVIHPLTLSGEKVAVFLVDALRYELAMDLIRDFQADPARAVKIQPRFAELPTITAVGMNALAPVSTNERTVVMGSFTGLKRPNSEFTVNAPSKRADAMAQRSGFKKRLSLSLEDLLIRSTQALATEVKSHTLIVVHSREIDDAGEGNFGLSTFDDTLEHLKSGWHRLEQAGVKQFVITADHGFLLQSGPSTVKFQTAERVERRWAFGATQVAQEQMVSVSTESLKYDGISGYLAFREDTLMFEKPSSAPSFVHGGNSPQERIIPVITVTRKMEAMQPLEEYRIEVEAIENRRELQGIRVKVVTAGFALHLDPLVTVEVAIRCVGSQEARVEIKALEGGGARQSGARVVLRTGGDWANVFFTLEGREDGRAQIEVYHPDNLAKVQSATPHDWYSVLGGRRSLVNLAELSIENHAPKSNATLKPAEKPTKSASDRPPANKTSTVGEPANTLAWAELIEDEPTRKVFLHIEKHNAIVEEEVTRILGGPRAFRKFSLGYESYLSKIPFEVKTEVGTIGKRYVKGGTK